MQKLSTKTLHIIWAIFVLSVLSSSFSFAQIVIKDSIDIGPKQLLHPQSESSGDLIIEIAWLGGLPTGVHLEVLDPNSNLLGFDPYTESANGDYVEVSDGPDGGVSRLTISSPAGGFYQIMAIVDTSVTPFEYRRLYAHMYAGGDISFVAFSGDEFGAYFGEVLGTRFHEDVAYWTLYVPCVSDSLTLVVDQIGYVYQPYLDYDQFYFNVQDGCGRQQDPGSGYFIRLELLDGLQWGDLYDPNSGRFGSVIDSIPIISGQGCFVYRPWGDVVVQPEQVDLKISSNFPGFTPSMQSFQVLPGNPPLEVLADRDAISYGDTTTIKLIMENSDGTPSSGQLVGSRFTILEGDSGAFLYSPDSTIIGRDIFNVDSVRLYVPPATASSTSSTIKLIVEALEPCSNCYASIAVRNGSGMLPSGTVKAKTTKADGKSSLSQREALYRASMLALRKKAAYSLRAPVSLTKNGKPAPQLTVTFSKKSKTTPQGISDYDGLTTSHYGMGIVTVMAPTGCPAVVLSSNHINLGDTVNMTVKMKINDTTFVDYPAGTLFDIGITSGGQYGTLVANGKSSNVGLDSVTVPIKFIASSSLTADSVAVLISGNLADVSVMTGSAANSGSKTVKAKTNNAKEQGKKFSPMKSETCGDRDVVLSVFNERDGGCPPGTTCNFIMPIIPQLKVQTISFAQAPPNPQRCQNSSDGKKIATGEFETLRTNEKGIKTFSYDENSLIICCNSANKVWRLQLPDLTFYAVLDLCPDAVTSLTDFNPCDPKFQSPNVKPRLIQWLEAGSKHYPVDNIQLQDPNNHNKLLFDGANFYVKEATLAHESYHLADYQKDIYTAAAEIYRKELSQFQIDQSVYKSYDEAKEVLDNKAKIMTQEIMFLANQIYASRSGDLDDYELKTQNKVANVYAKYESKLEDPATYCH